MGNRTRTTEMKKKNMEKDTNSFPHLPLSDSISHTNPKPILTPKEQRQLNNKLLLSVKRKNINKVETYLEQGADVNTRDNWDGTALILAAEVGLTDVCKLLIEKGADVIIRDGWRNSALIRASEFEHLDTVKYLLSVGANPLLKNKDGETAYFLVTDHKIGRILKRYMKLWEHVEKKNTQTIFRSVKKCNPDAVYKIFVGL